MVRLALLLAFGAAVAAGLPAPGAYVALGAGIAAIAAGRSAFGRRDATGAARLTAAGAIAVGTIGCVLGAVRVVLVLAAIGHLERLLP